MKILFIGHEASRTGAPLVLMKVIKTLKLENVKCDLLILSGGALKEEYKHLADRTYLIKPKSLANKVLTKILHTNAETVIAIKIFIKLLLNKYDLIYANSVASLRMAVALKKMLKKKMILHVHELEYSIAFNVGNAQFKEYAKSCDLFIAVSQAVKNSLIHTYGINQNLIEVIYPYPQKNEEIAGHIVREKLGIGKNTFVIGGAGQMSWTKSVDTFMVIAKEYAKRAVNQDFIFIWVGGFPKGKTESEQFRILKEKLAPLNIIFTDEVNNPQDYYNCFSVFLLTSKEESFSLVAVENAILRKPVICFEKCGGINDWVSDGSGIEVPFFDMNSIVHALLELAESAELRNTIGNKGYNTVSERFNETNFSKALKQVIEMA